MLAAFRSLPGNTVNGVYFVKGTAGKFRAVVAIDGRDIKVQILFRISGASVEACDSQRNASALQRVARLWPCAQPGSSVSQRGGGTDKEDTRVNHQQIISIDLCKQ